MKIEELFETRKSGSEYIKYDVELSGFKSDPKDGIALMQKHASDAMWMLEKNRPIYRGTNDGSANDVHIADPSKTERVSTNTPNYYTIILDNHPEMKEFPKRSKSFIASTGFSRALSYAHRDREQLFVLIPFNGVKIGIVPSEDIWDLTIRFMKSYYEIEGMNNSFSQFDIKPNSIDDIKEYARRVKDERRIYDAFVREFKSTSNTDDVLWDARQDLMKVIWDAYSPRHTGLTCATTATMDKTLSNNEVWVGGKCLYIRYHFWKKMVKEYNKKA